MTAQTDPTTTPFDIVKIPQDLHDLPVWMPLGDQRALTDTPTTLRTALANAAAVGLALGTSDGNGLVTTAVRLSTLRQRTPDETDDLGLIHRRQRAYDALREAQALGTYMEMPATAEFLIIGFAPAGAAIDQNGMVVITERFVPVSTRGAVGDHLADISGLIARACDSKAEPPMPAPAPVPAPKVNVSRGALARAIGRLPPGEHFVELRAEATPGQMVLNVVAYAPELCAGSTAVFDRVFAPPPADPQAAKVFRAQGGFLQSLLAACNISDSERLDVTLIELAEKISGKQIIAVIGTRGYWDQARPV
jgi:hypothetical protein